MDFQSIYEKITNSLMQLRPEEFTILASRMLRDTEDKMPADYKGVYPWFLLYLIKQVWLVGGSGSPLKPLTREIMVALLNDCINLEGAAAKILLGDPDPYAAIKYLRSLANLEFDLQRELGLWIIARPYHLFSRLGEDDPINELFGKKGQLGIVSALEIFFVIWAWLNKSPANNIFDPIQLLQHLTYPETMIREFFSITSLESTNIKTYLEENRPVKSDLLAVYEKSPLINKPFLILKNGSYLCYSKKLLQSTISTFFVQLFKKATDQQIKAFASILEKYVGELLTESKLDFYSEQQLKKEFSSSKVTDFLVFAEDSNIYIEVKSHEIKQLVKVHSKDAQLRKALKDNVIKATTQGMELISTIKANQSKIVKQAQNNYLLIVTATQYDLGPGLLIYNEFLGEEIAKVAEKKGIDPSLLLPQNIFVCDIEEFEMFLVSVVNHSLDVSKLMAKISAEGLNPQTQKIHFGQNFDDYIKQNPDFPLLKKESDAFIKDLKARFGKLDL